MAHELYKNVGGGMSTDRELLELYSRPVPLAKPKDAREALNDQPKGD